MSKSIRYIVKLHEKVWEEEKLVPEEMITDSHGRDRYTYKKFQKHIHIPKYYYAQKPQQSPKEIDTQKCGFFPVVHEDAGWNLAFSFLLNLEQMAIHLHEFQCSRYSRAAITRTEKRQAAAPHKGKMGLVRTATEAKTVQGKKKLSVWGDEAATCSSV